MDTLTYKNFIGTVHYSIEDEIFHGKIEGIDALVTFEAENSREIKREFYEAVDDYLSFCKEKGINPYRSFSGSFSVRVKPELHKKAYQTALLRGVSLNKIVSDALMHELRVQYNTSSELSIVEENEDIKLKGSSGNSEQRKKYRRRTLVKKTKGLKK